MSAFEVGATHIDALLTAGLLLDREYGPLRWYWPASAPVGSVDLRHAELTQETANRVGAMLVAENRASVNYRYDEDELEAVYEFRSLPGRPEPLVVLKAIACYAYQACEHPGWGESEARAFCDALRLAAIAALPGYQEADAWPVDDRRVFAPAVTVRQWWRDAHAGQEPEASA